MHATSHATILSRPLHRPPGVAPSRDPVSPILPAPPTGALEEIGKEYHARGWSLGTSGNYSVALSQKPLRLLITGSGFDKGRLRPEHFVVIDETGRAVEAGGARPSAETLLHLAIVAQRGAGAVLHTHSLWGTLLSELGEPDGGLALRGYEMLKGLRGVTTHEHRLWLKIFPNTQDIPALALELTAGLQADDPGLSHGFLLAGHGLYTWGSDLAEARRHVEVLEFLLEAAGRRRSLR